jgi:hypothetical protein
VQRTGIVTLKKVKNADPQCAALLRSEMAPVLIALDENKLCSGWIYVFLTDIGRFSRNAVTRALFTFKPPL